MILENLQEQIWKDLQGKIERILHGEVIDMKKHTYRYVETAYNFALKNGEADITISL